jgi:hypothetical protein
MRWCAWLVLVLLVCAVAACSESTPRGSVDAETRRQRDSAIARMPIPGARAVDRALGTLEASQSRAAALDSIR